MENLESQLREEPFVLAFLISFFEFGSYKMAGLLFLHRIFQDLLVKVGFVEAYINSIPSWHQMVIIDDLQKLNNFIFRKIVSMRKISKSSKYAKKAREIV